MDDVRAFLCAFCVTLIFDKSSLLGEPVCDGSKSADLPEGNIRESAHFPWLGVLRVHLHHGDSMKIALTGLILVKPKYAVANSEDIAKIPNNVLKRDSKVMFIPKGGEPWYCTVKDFTMHPEYEYSTFNTVALLELAFNENERVPFDPVCWPGVNFNTSNQLYALGYTDERQLLEKTVYKLQYVKPSLCEEFYSRSGLVDYKMKPTHMQCGYAINNKHDCQWENGMALASNSSGKWHLIGISLRGPGCSAPARFLDMSTYFPWIESATDLEEINDYDFRRSNSEINLLRKKDVAVDPRFSYKYRNREWQQTQQPFTIDRVDNDAIRIMTFDKNNMYEYKKGSCSQYKNLVYRDQTRIVDKFWNRGIATYRLSVYNMVMQGFTCVKLKAVASGEVQSKLWYRTQIDPDDEFAHSGAQTPEELLKEYQVNRREPVYDNDTTTTTPTPGSNTTNGTTPWVPGPHLEPKHIKDTADYSNIRNLNILVWFSYTGTAKLEIEVYGLPWPRWTFQQRDPIHVPKNRTTEKPKRRMNEKPTKRPKFKRLHFIFQNVRENKTDRLKTQVQRTKSRHSNKLRNPYNKDRNSPSRVNRRQQQRYRSRYKANAPQNASYKMKRLHHSYQSGNIQPKNSYRLQKAILREAERLSKSSKENHLT